VVQEEPQRRSGVGEAAAPFAAVALGAHETAGLEVGDVVGERRGSEARAARELGKGELVLLEQEEDDVQADGSAQEREVGLLVGPQRFLQADGAGAAWKVAQVARFAARGDESVAFELAQVVGGQVRVEARLAGELPQVEARVAADGVPEPAPRLEPKEFVPARKGEQGREGT
jgi:hypothetical protein